MEEKIDYGQLMNQAKIAMVVPEYYQTQLPDYFRTPRQAPLPMLNGHPVSHEEYRQRFPDYEIPVAIRPKLIYENEALNVAHGFRTPIEIVDMFINQVPFSFYRPESIGQLITILHGYQGEVGQFADRHAQLQQLLTNISALLQQLEPYWRDYCLKHQRQTEPTYSELLSILNA